MTILEILFKIKNLNDSQLVDFVNCIGIRRIEKIKIYLLNNYNEENNQLFLKLCQITDELYASKLNQFIALIKANRANELLEVLTQKEKYDLLMEIEFTNKVSDVEKKLPLHYLERSIEINRSR